MYEELVKKLRSHNGWALNETLDEAANAIEELQQIVEHYKGCSDDWYREACDYKAMLPRWIPVTERLPEDDDKRFLVCAKRFDGEPYVHICYHAKNLHKFDEYDFPNENRPGWYFYDSEYGWIEKEDVTHWMPLPEPPKEET